MPRTPEQNQNIKDRRKSKLLAFALKAFALNGYDHTAIDDITKPAKCSHGLFYHYFDSKEMVFRALINEYLTKEFEVPVQQALEAKGMNGLRILAEYAERSAAGGPKGIAVARVTFSLGEAEDLDEYGLAFRDSHNVEAALVELLRQGQEEGSVIEGDPKTIATIFMDLARGCFFRLEKRPNEPKVNADILCRLVSR